MNTYQVLLAKPGSSIHSGQNRIQGHEQVVVRDGSKMLRNDRFYGAAASFSRVGKLWVRRGAAPAANTYEVLLVKPGSSTLRTGGG